MFCRIQNLHISQTVGSILTDEGEFCRIQNLHISQTETVEEILAKMFCRIQNLHISQTDDDIRMMFESFVEFKIYISLKRKKC